MGYSRVPGAVSLKQRWRCSSSKCYKIQICFHSHPLNLAELRPTSVCFTSSQNPALPSSFGGKPGGLADIDILQEIPNILVLACRDLLPFGFGLALQAGLF